MKDNETESIYKNHHCAILLKQGDYKGYHYAIVTYGSHPCAYIKVMGITDEDIYVHGGITFEGGEVADWFPELPKGNYIGWDYGHAGDYISLFGWGVKKGPFNSDKEWTFDEIYTEVKNAIDQIEVVKGTRLKMSDLVILSLYDSGYYGSFMENGIVKTIYEIKEREEFKLRFGKYPEDITLRELKKHYPKGTTVIICTDGDIVK